MRSIIRECQYLFLYKLLFWT